MKAAATGLALAFAFAFACAIATPAHADAAGDIVALPGLKAVRTEMETAIGDVLARPVFRSLRGDADWGPASRVWQVKSRGFATPTWSLPPAGSRWWTASWRPSCGRT